MADQTLEEMNGVKPPSLEEMSASLQADKAYPLYAPNSVRTRSANAAVLSDDPEAVAQTFVAAQQEAQASGTSTIADFNLEQQNRRVLADSEQFVRDMMGDPDVPVEEKAQALKGAASQQTVKTSNYLVTEAGLIAEAEGNTETDEFVRMTAADMLAEYEEAAKEIQAAHNAEYVNAYKGENRDAKAAWDLFKLYLIPLVEVESANNIEKALLGDTGTMLHGNVMKNISDAFGRMLPEQQVEFTHQLIDFLNSEEGATFLGDNEMDRMMWLREEIAQGNISNTEVWINNVASVIEGIFFFNPVAKPVIKTGGILLRNAAEAISTARAVAKTNPSKARVIYKLASEDESGEVAKAMYGTDRTGALADEHMPPVMDGRAIPNDKAYKPWLSEDPVKNQRDLQYQGTEQKVAQLEVKLDFESTDPHLQLNVSPVSIDEVDGGFVASAVYGRKQGGFQFVEDAIDTTMLGLRKYGITEKDLTVLKNTGDGYKPMTKTEMRGALDGDYKVQVNYKHDMNPLNAKDGSILDADYHGLGAVFKTLANKYPTLPRYIFDPAALFKKEFQGSAAAMVDQSARLEKQMLSLSRGFSDDFKRLGKESKYTVWNYIQKANKEGLSDARHELIAKGFDDAEIETLRKWREFWDEAWRMENSDVIKTLRARGFMYLEDQVHGTKVFARPLASPHVVPRTANIYDAKTGKIVQMSTEDLNKLYEGGGQVAKMRHAEVMEGKAVEYVMTTNTKSNYLRGIRDEWDTALEYRDGYYSVRYKDPIFIRKNIVDDNGVVVGQKAVATAESTADATKYIKLKAAEEGKTVDEWGTLTTDLNIEDVDADLMDIAESTGRSSQRMRGERLDNASDPQNALSDRHIEGPVESMIHASRSLANRVPSRDWIEGMKSRWMRKYGHLTSEVEGRHIFPNKHEDISIPGQGGNKMTAEAKQAWEYIHYMENGYVSALDTGIKASLNTIANIVAGAPGLGKVEKGLRNLQKGSPQGLGKSLAFNAYLATNPLRQLIVQSHQAMQLSAVAPKYFFSKLTVDASAVLAGKVLDGAGSTKLFNQFAAKVGYDPSELRRLIKDWDESGLAASIDHQNLVEGSLNQLADASWTMGRLKAGAGAPLRVLRRAGFDAGENANLLTAFLTFRNKAMEAGLDVSSKKAVAQIAQEARNFTYNMNRAGDMPYNRNSWGMLLQFLQVPHKALLNMTVNKQISGWDKVRLGVANTLLYGVPSVTVLEILDSGGLVPEDPALRDLYVNGIEQAILNTTLTTLTGEESNIDLASMAPLELHGWLNVARVFAEEGPIALLSESPTGKLVSSRVWPALKELGRFFGQTEPRTPQDALNVIERFAAISSGYSNFMKVQMIDEYGRLYSKNRMLLDNKVTPPEQVALLFGLSDKETRGRYRVSRQQYLETQEAKDDVARFVKEQMEALYFSDSISDQSKAIDILAGGWAVFDNPVQRKELRRLVEQRFSNDPKLLRRMLEFAGIKSGPEFRSMMDNVPFTPEQKAVLDDINNLNNGEQE